ncbi:MAG: hypothetical protein JWN83_2034 [Chitinophagaceae bacterium]|nr:hypothetical protein [Chitinophagaceae bacterium]
MADDQDQPSLDSNATDQPDPSNEIIPVEDTETIKPIQQTENMEVHKHPHHVAHKKKWGEYLLEFFMLFLAVFLGFVAENIREHQVEQQRATELAKNLYNEIYADSISVQQKLSSRNVKEKQCAYFISYVRDSSLTTLSPSFYPAFTWSFIQTVQLLFDPNDGILNQLRNSGELRYFKSSELQARIGEFSVAIANLRSRNEKEYSYVEFYLRPFTLKYYDFAWYETITQHGKLTLLNALNQSEQTSYAGKIVNVDKFSRQEAGNIASYYLLMLRGTRQQYYGKYATINHQLLQILRKEYHIK